MLVRQLVKRMNSVSDSVLLSGQLLHPVKDSSVFFSITKVEGVGVLFLLGSC